MKRVPNSELDVLQALWRSPSQTAKQIADRMHEQGRKVSISSVQTLLRRLEARRLVSHEATGKTFYFTATCEPDDVRSAHARDLLDRMFGGAVSGFVAQLMDEDEITDEELRELRAMIDANLKRRKKK